MEENLHIFNISQIILLYIYRRAIIKEKKRTFFLLEIRHD